MIAEGTYTLANDNNNDTFCPLPKTGPQQSSDSVFDYMSGLLEQKPLREHPDVKILCTG